LALEGFKLLVSDELLDMLKLSLVLVVDMIEYFAWILDKIDLLVGLIAVDIGGHW